MADVITLDEIEQLKSVMETSFNEVKSTVNNIYGKLDTEVADIVSKVATNNTANKTGILSQKLSYLIQQNEVHGMQEYKTAGTFSWTCPTGVTKIIVVAIGGGGGGGAGARGNYQGNYGERKGGGGGSGAGGAILEGYVNVMQNKAYSIIVGGPGHAHTIKSQGASNYIGKTEFNNDGTSGGQTKCFGIIANGGGAGKNGTVATDYNSGEGYGKGGAGGAGGSTSVGSTNTSTIIANETVSTTTNGSSGKDGNTSTGGICPKNTYNLSCGGAGGTGSAYDENATNGSAGQPGYVRIIW